MKKNAVRPLDERSALRTLVPLNTLTPDNFEDLLSKITIEELSSGKVLFEQGDTDNKSVYLLSGQVTLKENNSKVDTIEGGTEQARYPLAHHIPRQLSATAKSNISFIRLDTALLDVLIASDRPPVADVYQVNEIIDGDESDWMTQVLTSKAFANLSAANIQSLFMHLEPQSVKEGDVIIRQGDEGRYYYIIRQGRCSVTRKSDDKREDVTLAELSSGDGFGEESLISNTKRNATVTMLTDGELMRLSKDKFDELMKDTLLYWVSFDEATALAKEGAVWLDVRLPNEYKKFHIKGSKNMPLSVIRKKVKSLKSNNKYIMYCDNSRRSSIAAFLLSQHGFEAVVLSGGYDPENSDIFTSPEPLKQESPKQAVEEAVIKPDKAVEIVDINAKKVASKQSAPKAGVATGAASQDKPQTEKEAILKRAREEMKKRQEAEAEVARLRAEQRNAIRKAEEEAHKRGAAEAETKKLREQAKAAKKTAEAEIAKIRNEEKEARKRVETEIKKLKARQETLKKSSDKEATQLKSEQDKAQKKALEEAERFKREAEAIRNKMDQEKLKLDAERERAKHQAAQEAKRLHDEAELVKKEAEEAAARLIADAQAMQEKAEIEARKQVKKQASKIVAEVEAAKQKAEQERDRLLAEAESAKLNAQAEALKLEAAQESARLKAEEEVAKLKAEAEAARFKAEEENRKLTEAETKRIAAEAAAARQKSDAEKARLETLAEANRLKAETEAAQHKTREEAAQLKAEAEKARRQAEEEAARLSAEAARIKAEKDKGSIEDVARLETEAKAARFEADETLRMVADAEQARARSEMETARLMAEVEATRKEAELEATRLKKEAEKMRNEALKEVEKFKQEAKTERQKAEVEAQRLKAEADEARKRAEAETVRLQHETEQAKIKSQQHIDRLNEDAEAGQRKVNQVEAEAGKKQKSIPTNEAAEEASIPILEIPEIQPEAGNYKRPEGKGHYVEVPDNFIPGNSNEISAVDVIARAVESNQSITESISEVVSESYAFGKDSVSQSFDKDTTSVQHTGTKAVFSWLSGNKKRGAGIIAGVFVVLIAIISIILFSSDESSLPDERATTSPEASTTEPPTTLKAIGDKKPAKKSILVKKKKPATRPDSAANKETLTTKPADAKVSKQAAEVKPIEQKSSTKKDTSGSKVSQKNIQAQEASTQGELIEKEKQEEKNSASPEKEQATPKTSNDVEKAAKEEQPKIALRTEPKRTARIPVRIRTFSDTLAMGGRGPVMVVIPAGPFEMGSPDVSTNFDERPRHKVRISRFAISKYEVTIGEYRKFLQATNKNPDKPLGTNDSQPMTNINWQDAVDYADWLSKQTGQKYRLPSEAEWEYATAVGADTAFWWGQELGSNRAACYGCGSEWDQKSTAPVGTFKPNTYGLYDMSGNVNEWIRDCYHEDYNGAPSNNQAWEEAGCELRVARGGAFDSPSDNLRIRHRSKFKPDTQLDNLGIRLVREY